MGSNAQCRRQRDAEKPQKATVPPRSGGRPKAGGSRRFRSMAQLRDLLRPFHGSVLLLLALSLGAVAIEVVPPLLQGQLVDRVLAGNH